MSNEIIAVTQLPVIEEKLQQLKEDISLKVSDALALDCTEETRAQIKKIRTELKKDFTFYENKRKEVKKAILEPYEAFEVIYKECVGDIFSYADRELKSKIDSVERELLQEKEAQIFEYFVELSNSEGLDFLNFSDVGVQITLSASKASLKKQVSDFVQKVSEDLNMINSFEEDAAEILVEYKKTFNASQAIMTVKKRHTEIESAKANVQNVVSHEEDKHKSEQKISEIVDGLDAASDAPISAPVSIPVKEQITEPEAGIMYSVTFTVKTHNIDDLKKLKKFLKEEGIHYEQFS